MHSAFFPTSSENAGIYMLIIDTEKTAVFLCNVMTAPVVTLHLKLLYMDHCHSTGNWLVAFQVANSPIPELSFSLLSF